jgi:hypothetical protein
MSWNGSSAESSWAGEPPEAEVLEAVHAPVGWLLAAVALGVLGLLTIPLRALPVHLVAYVVTTFGCVGLLGRFLQLDHRARATKRYLVTPWSGTAYRIAASLALLAAAGHVWVIATWLAS